MSTPGTSSGPVAPLLQFWGKARPAPDAACPWHPLLWHGLDVAAVGAVLLRRQPGLAARLRASLGGDARDLLLLESIRIPGVAGSCGC